MDYINDTRTYRDPVNVMLSDVDVEMGIAVVILTTPEVQSLRSATLPLPLNLLVSAP